MGDPVREILPVEGSSFESEIQGHDAVVLGGDDLHHNSSSFLGLFGGILSRRGRRS